VNRSKPTLCRRTASHHRTLAQADKRASRIGRVSRRTDRSSDHCIAQATGRTWPEVAHDDWLIRASDHRDMPRTVDQGAARRISNNGVTRTTACKPCAATIQPPTCHLLPEFENAIAAGRSSARNAREKNGRGRTRENRRILCGLPPSGRCRDVATANGHSELRASDSSIKVQNGHLRAIIWASEKILL
jgi:hypothetical protein